jgi:uncharacterized protein (TIGR02452 family)
MNQKQRIDVANDTLDILDKGFYLNNKGQKVDIDPFQKYTIEQTEYFTPEALSKLVKNFISANNFNTKFEVTNETTCDAVRRLVAAGEKDVMALNFASAKNPGGGFLGGALAQEECIARASALYPSLLQVEDYYTTHRQIKTGLYSDRMIYSPAVPIFKDENGHLLDEPVCTTIITSPAVNAGVVRRDEGEEAQNSILSTMEKRIAKLLALSAHKQHLTLVLGAWGCGVFRNSPEDIAQLFKEALTGPFAGQFKKVVFAVYTNKEEMIDAFRVRFI